MYTAFLGKDLSTDEFFDDEKRKLAFANGMQKIKSVPDLMHVGSENDFSCSISLTCSKETAEKIQALLGDTGILTDGLFDQAPR